MNTVTNMERYLQTFLQPFQDLKIQMEEITSATNNFDDRNCIGGGGFGKVYKGQVSHSKGRSMAAIKRLDPKHGQGIPEFLKEIRTLSDYSHENLISLLGFCYQGNEMILVYEHASRSSLDKHLNSIHLTWSQRLKICLDAAKGLSFLHDPRDTHRRLIHCDVKSSNILLDGQWTAKVSDLGLSIMGSANEQHSIIVTLAAGTKGYIDPLYWMTHTLTKESDVYSFGVVLFEVLCGRLCYTHSKGHVQQLVPTWIESYKQKKLIDIIFKNQTIQALDESALEVFSAIAYQCLNEYREDRPDMAKVVNELEIALDSQEVSEGKPLIDYEKMAKTAEPPLNYRSKVELQYLVSKGVLLNGGKTWFSVNKNGEHCELISFAQCLGSEFKRNQFSSVKSRFPVGNHRYKNGRVKTCVRTHFLSLGVTYTVNFVFRIFGNNKEVFLRYKLQGESKPSISYLAEMREDGWWMCELYQFTCDRRSIDLEIVFDGFYNDNKLLDEIIVEGIEFWPLEKVEHKDDEKQSISDSDANWEDKSPTGYEDIMKWSKDSVHWTTKKEAYSIMFKGFLINDGQKWFSLDKNGKKCHMQSVRAADIDGLSKIMLSLPESRFREAAEYKFSHCKINCEIQSQLVSSQTTYAVYLVYKLSHHSYAFHTPMKVKDRISKNEWYFFLISPQTPVIRPKTGQNTHNPLNRSKTNVPQQRNDGWMEVKIWEFRTATTTEKFSMSIEFGAYGYKTCSGLIIQGIEFRPI